MSRQAKIVCDIVVKDIDQLKEAVKLTCQELGGIAVNTVRYYAGEIVVGIRADNIEVGITIGKDGKLTFVGEDYILHSPAGQKIIKCLQKHYKSLAIVKVFKKVGYATTFRPGAKNFITGVRS